MRRLTVLLLLALVAPAHAARVSERITTAEDEELGTYAILRYTAGPGERNRPTVARLKGHRNTVVVTDPGAVLEAGRFCKSMSPHVVHCKPGYWTYELIARLGDRGDVWPADQRFEQIIHGGRGPDVLVGGLHAQELDGGPGADRIDGGHGDDSIADGDGRDHVIGGQGADTLHSTDTTPVPDRFRGGPSDGDLLVFDRSEPVRIALGERIAEGEQVRGVERFAGSAHDDVLIGTDGPDWLAGAAGDDRIEGRAGDDTLEPGAGYDDHVEGGAGNDSLGIPGFGTGYGVTYRCGEGDDVAGTGIDGREFYVTDDCEQTTWLVFGTLPAHPTRVTPDSVHLTLICGSLPLPTPEASADRTVRLLTPTAKPWARDPEGVVVAEGELPECNGIQTAEVELTITDAGRALPRPFPVAIRSDYFPGWTFNLPAASSSTSAP